MQSASDITGRDRHFIRKAGARLIALFVAFVFAISLPVAGAGSALADTGAGLSAHVGVMPSALPDVSEVLPVAETLRELDRSRFDTFPVVLADTALPVERDDTLTRAEFVAPGGFYLNPAGFLPFSRGPPAFS